MFEVQFHIIRHMIVLFGPKYFLLLYLHLFDDTILMLGIICLIDPIFV